MVASGMAGSCLANRLTNAVDTGKSVRAVKSKMPARASVAMERVRIASYILRQQPICEPTIDPEEQDIVDRVELKAVAHGRPW
jgi:hypothetical protein